jgi:exopolyphosphatase/guanosine-5'-triphosphate,3'-diphosphate pyrophosphatase
MLFQRINQRFRKSDSRGAVKISTKAVIDIGTNSIKLLVAREDGSRARVLADETRITKLGEGSSASGFLSDKAMHRTVLVIAEMEKIARSYESGQTIAVATQAVRGAANSLEFIGLVAEICGVHVNIITGDEEAALSFDAAAAYLRHSMADSKICVFDVGGGSSEIVTGDFSSCCYRCSIPIGALSLYDELFSESNGPTPDDILKKSADKLKKMLAEQAKDDEVRSCGMFAGVGGTITTLAAVAKNMSHYESDEITGFILDESEVTRQINLYASLGVDDRKKITGLSPKRADIILPGAGIVQGLMNFAGTTHLTVLDRGLRYGVMKKFFNISPQ